MKHHLILASSSPRRASLLREYGIRCTVIIPHVAEDYSSSRPSQIVMELAEKKAAAVSKTVSRGLILGADTIVVAGGEIIGKPQNLQHARKILRQINGKINYVYTGIALIDAEKKTVLKDYEKSKVYMRKLGDKKLRTFARRHLDKAGAYAVQEHKDAFVKKVVGDYTNVVGLPMRLLKRMITEIYR
ncbi:MAG: Maf family protein [bacterium]